MEKKIIGSRWFVMQTNSDTEFCSFLLPYKQYATHVLLTDTTPHLHIQYLVAYATAYNVPQ